MTFVGVPQEQSHNMEALDEQNGQGDQGEGGPVTKREGWSQLWVLDVFFFFFF